MINKKYYMYVLLTADNTFYAGFTDDVFRRLAVHESGKGAKYTRPKKRHPLRLIYSESFVDKSKAMKAEASFKRLTRIEKKKFLIEHGVENIYNN